MSQDKKPEGANHNHNLANHNAAGHGGHNGGHHHSAEEERALEERKEATEKLITDLKGYSKELLVKKTGAEVFVDLSKFKKKEIVALEKFIGKDGVQTVRKGVVGLHIQREALEKVAKNLDKGMWVVDVASGALEIANEDTARHKMQRGVAVGADLAINTLPGVLVSTGVVTNTALSGAALTAGGSLAVTTASVAVPIVATYLVSKDINTAIETDRLYEKVDSTYQLDPKDKSNLIKAETILHDKLKEKGATFNKKGKLDFTQDKNRAIMQRVISEARGEAQNVIDNNSTIIPRWMAFTQNQANMHGNKALAQEDLRLLDNASTELNIVRDEVKALKKENQQHLHHGQDHGHGLTAAKGPQKAAANGRG